MRKSLQGPLGDESRATQVVARGGAEGGGDDGKRDVGGRCGDRRTRGGRDGGGWGETDTKKDMTHWEKVLAMVRADFGEGRLAQ